MRTSVKVLGGLLVVLALVQAFGPKAPPEDPALAARLERERAQEREGRMRVREAEGLIRSRLKDPESAQFSGVIPVRHGDTLTVCGEVNARNSFGGYTGRKAFLVIGRLAMTEDDVEGGVFTEMWNKLCTDGGRGAAAQ